jgi:hypothetical protein
MKDVKNLEMSLRNIQTSLTSLGGGGLGERDVIRLIQQNSTNLSDSDLDYIASQVGDDFLDSAEAIKIINETVDSAYVNALIEASDLDSAHVLAIVTENDLDMAGNRVLFSNVYSNLADLPDPNAYHGMFAHVHATGEAYFSHAGAWHQLLRDSGLGTLDSADALQLIDTRVPEIVDSAYVSARIDISTTLDSSDYDEIADRIGDEFLDSAEALKLIEETVDSAYVNARIDANLADNIDSSAVIGVIEETVDSAYVTARVDASLSLDVLDSAEVQVMIDNTFAASPSIIPANANVTLGDSNNPFGEIFVSGNSIHLGSLKLTEDTSGADPQFKVVSESQPDQVLKVDLEVNSVGDLGDVTLTSSLSQGHLLSWDSDNDEFRNSALDLSAIHFKGSVDVTTETAPANPDAGDLYLNTVAGTVDASWTGIGGSTIAENVGIVYATGDGEWHVTSGISSTGVTSVVSTTPSLKVDNSTPAEPSLSIVDASADSAGLMSAGHFRKVESELDSAIAELDSDVTDRVKKSGDTMTGDLTLTDSADFETVGGHITTRKGDVRVFEGGKVLTNKITSIGNSNLSIQRNSTTKIMLGDSDTIVYNRLNPRKTIVSEAGGFGPAMTVIGRDSENDPALQIWNSGGISTNYTDFQDDEFVTKKYVDSAIASEQGSDSDLLADHEARLVDHEARILESEEDWRELYEVGLQKSFFTISRKYNASLYDEENNVLFTYRTQDEPASWHDNVKFNFLLTDLSRPDYPGRAYAGIKTQYKTGGNNEYLALVAPVKYNGKYYVFPRNRPFDGQIGYFDPAALVDSDGSLEGPNLKGQVGVTAGDRTLVLTKSECGQINTASPLTTDGQYVLVAGSQTDTFTNTNAPGKKALAVLVDLEKAENNQEYETFYREYSGKGSVSSDRRAAGKAISETIGGYSMAVENGDGTNSVYFFQPGAIIHKAVVNDLSTYDVTVEPIGSSENFLSGLAYTQLATGLTVSDRDGSNSGTPPNTEFRIDNVEWGGHFSFQPDHITNGNVAEGYILKLDHSGGTTYARVAQGTWTNGPDTHGYMDILNNVPLVDGSSITVSVHKDANLNLPNTFLPAIEYIMYNGGRVDYKGRLSGLTVYKNRWILFHALGYGIYSFDTDDETLTLLCDTSNDLVRYGVMRYEKGKGVPEIHRCLYFIPEGATAQDNVTYDLRVLKVNPDFTVDQIPFDIPDFGCDFSIVSGDENLMMFNQGSETFYVYDVFINKLQTIVSDTKIYSGTPYGPKAAILTPRTDQSAANKWDYPTMNFYVAGNSLSASIVRNTDFTENQLIADHDSDLVAYSDLSLTTVVPDHEERITEHDTNWRELYEFGLEGAGFSLSRKMHTSLWDSEENVLFTWRTQDVPESWHDNVKFSTLVTDLNHLDTFPYTRSKRIKTQYKSGGNNEYLSLIASPIKWGGKYFAFPQNRPFDGQIGYFDPAATQAPDSDGEGNLLKGNAGVWGDVTLVLANGDCGQINTATPLTTDGQYVIVTGAQTDTFTSTNPPDKNPLVVLVDLEKAGNNQEYEEFYKEYTGSGDGSSDRRAAGKVISDTIGSYSMHVENGDGTNSVYFFQAGQAIHKAVVNDLDTYDVTVEPLTSADDLQEYLDGLAYAEILTGYTIQGMGGSFSGTEAGKVRIQNRTTGGHISWNPDLVTSGDIAPGYVLKFEHDDGVSYARVMGNPWTNDGEDDTHANVEEIIGPVLPEGGDVVVSVHQQNLSSDPAFQENLPLEYVVINGGRVTYKGRISGLTVYKNRWIIFHSLGYGLYALDTSNESLTLIFDTSDDLIRYGVMQYEKNKGVPEYDGNLYFIPQSASAPNSVTYDTRILRVNEIDAKGNTSNMTVTALPFDVPGFGCDFSINAGNETIMMFNQGSETSYIYDFYKNSLTTIVSDNGIYSGTPCRGEVILTPRTDQSAANQWDYPTVKYLVTGNAISEGIVRNTNYLNNRLIANHDSDISSLLSTIEELTARIESLESP